MSLKCLALNTKLCNLQVKSDIILFHLLYQHSKETQFLVYVPLRKYNLPDRKENEVVVGAGVEAGGH
jgi:hypothetical protein